jgi:Leucine-rich repeat (LRR) protein
MQNRELGMQVKYVVFIVILAILYCGCTAKRIDTNEKNLLAEDNKLLEEPEPTIIDIIPYIQLHGYSEDRKRGSIRQEELNAAGLSDPDSLREIADRVRSDERENVFDIEIGWGVQSGISSLDGIELFPNLTYFSTWKSKIRRITGGQPGGNPLLRRIGITSDEIEDISGITMYENLVTLSISSTSLLHFPDITRMENLRHLSLVGTSGINFNELKSKLPPKLKILELENCNIETLDEVSNLFNSCTRLYLLHNKIKNIDWDMDFGTLRRINFAWNPVAKDYYGGSENDYDGTSYIEGIIMNGIMFQFYFVPDDHMTFQYLMTLDED